MLQLPIFHSFIPIIALVFLAVLLLFASGYLLWKQYKGPEARKLQRRLRALSAAHDHSEQTQLVKARVLSEVPLLQRALLRMPRAHMLDRFILQAGLDWSVSGLLLSCAALFALGTLAVLMLSQALVLALVAGIALAILPLLYLQRRRNQRLHQLELQLPEALDLIARALRAGHAFSAGLQMVGDEMAEPIAGEFRLVHDEVNYGTSLEQALGNLGERVPLTDLRYFIVAVIIQRESGGNLTEVLGNLSHLIRERLKLQTKIRVLSSEGRLSAWILALMPFALGAVLYLFNREFMEPLWHDPIGITILQWLAVMMVLGVLLLRHIIRIRV